MLKKQDGLSVYELIKLGESKLINKKINNAFYESLVLMQYTLKKTLSETIIAYHEELSSDKAGKFFKLIERRFKKEPFAYIINKKEFYSLDFFVGKSVLIPRPDTECLVDTAINEIKRLSVSLKRKIRILDIGTGSGAIAISIAKNSDNVIIYAADNSIRSLNATRKNIIANEAADKVIPVYLDILKLKPAVKHNINYTDFNRNFILNGFNNFDIIISNPPYVETGELNALEDDIKLYEPVKALNGGRDGLKFYRKIFDLAALENLKNVKTLILEIDYRKRNEIYSLFNEKFKNIKFKNISFIKDLNNKERAVKITYG